MQEQYNHFLMQRFLDKSMKLVPRQTTRNSFMQSLPRHYSTFYKYSSIIIICYSQRFRQEGKHLIKAGNVWKILPKLMDNEIITQRNQLRTIKQQTYVKFKKFPYKTVCHRKIVWSLRPTGATVFYAVNNNNNRLQPHEIYFIVGGQDVVKPPPSLSLYTHIYIYIYTYVYVYIYTYTYTYMYIKANYI